MPPLPAVSKVIKLDFNFVLNTGTPLLTRLYFQYSGTAPTSAQLNTFCDSAGTAYVANQTNYTPPDTTLTGVSCVDLSSDTSPSGEYAFSSTGSRSGTELDAAASFVVGYEIARRFRGGHSRGYWRMGTDSDIASGQAWSPTPISDFHSGVSDTIGDIEGAGWSGAGSVVQVVVSYFSGFTVVINPVSGRARNIPKLRSSPVVDVVTELVPRTRIGSQRRRLGRG